MSNTWYSLEQIDRFIRSTLQGPEMGPLSDEDRRAAAWALLALLQGNDVRKELGIDRKRGQRGQEKGSSVDEITLDHPVMGVVMEWRSGGLKYGKAKEKIMKITGLGESTVKGRMTALKPRAEKTIIALDHMKSSATGEPPPDRGF